MTFYDLTITAAGDRYSKRVKESSELLPAAVQMMRGLIDAGGGEIPFDGLRHIRLQWTEVPSLPGTALATFWSRSEPLTTSALLTAGVGADDAREVLRAVQGLVHELLKLSPGAEPGFDLLTITERPVIASYVFPVGPHPDLLIVADMETCLAAAYFLREEKR